MQKILTNGNIKGIIIAISILLLTAGLFGIQSLMGFFKPDPPDVLQLDRETEISETTIAESSVVESTAVTELPTEITTLIETDPVISETTPANGYDPDKLAGHIAAWRIDGKPVAMTYGEIAEFEKQLFQSKTQAEYEAMMDKLYYYNKGVDMSRFSWTWDEYKLLYSEEQIAMMRSGQRLYKTLPNIVGMEMKAAYRYMTDLGFLARFAIQYDAGSTVPVGCCYYQDMTAGQKMYTDAAIMFYIQAPPEFYGQSVLWHPDDQDFDIYAYIEKTRQTGDAYLPVPDVVGLSTDEALAKLAAAGLPNVNIFRMYIAQDIAPGVCFEQEVRPGELVQIKLTMWIRVQAEYYIVPDVVGLSKNDAIAALSQAGLTAECIPYYQEGKTWTEGYCCFQSCSPGQIVFDKSVNIFIFTKPQSETEPTPTY